MREICEKQPDFEGIPEMLSKIVRRIADEDGVKKLTIETFQALFFQPVRERDSIVLIKKVRKSSITIKIIYIFIYIYILGTGWLSGLFFRSTDAEVRFPRGVNLSKNPSDVDDSPVEGTYSFTIMLQNKAFADFLTSLQYVKVIFLSRRSQKDDSNESS